MKKEEENFIRFLEEEYVKTQNDCTFELSKMNLDEINFIIQTKSGERLRNLYCDKEDIACLIRNCKKTKEEYKLSRLVFTEFDILSKYIIKSPLKANEKIKLLLDFLEKNNATTFLEDKKIHFDIVKLGDIDFDELTDTDKNYCQQILNDANLLTGLLRKNYNNLSSQGRRIKQVIQNAISEGDKESRSFINKLLTIKKSYFEKKDSYTEKDIEKVVKACSNIGVAAEICESLEYYLRSKLVKRNQESKQIVFLNPSNKPLEEILEESDRKAMVNELKSYYDFPHQRKVKKELTNQEIIRCAALAHKLGYSKRDLKEFFFNMGVRPPEFYVEDDDIDFYNSIKEKLDFYKEKFDYTDDAEFIKECFDEVIKTNDEFWKKEFKKYLCRIIKFLPNNFKIKPINDNIDKLVDNYDFEIHQAIEYSKTLKPNKSNKK